MRDVEMDQLFALFVIIMVPIILITFVLGQVLSSLVLVGVAGSYIYSRAKVRVAEIEAEAKIKAAEIEANRNRNLSSGNPGPRNPGPRNPGPTPPNPPTGTAA